MRTYQGYTDLQVIVPTPYGKLVGYVTRGDLIDLHGYLTIDDNQFIVNAPVRRQLSGTVSFIKDRYSIPLSRPNQGVFRIHRLEGDSSVNLERDNPELFAEIETTLLQIITDVLQAHERKFLEVEVVRLNNEILSLDEEEANAKTRLEEIRASREKLELEERAAKSRRDRFDGITYSLTI